MWPPLRRSRRRASRRSAALGDQSLRSRRRRCRPLLRLRLLRLRLWLLRQLLRLLLLRLGWLLRLGRLLGGLIERRRRLGAPRLGRAALLVVRRRRPCAEGGRGERGGGGGSVDEFARKNQKNAIFRQRRKNPRLLPQALTDGRASGGGTRRATVTRRNRWQHTRGRHRHGGAPRDTQHSRR